MKKLIYLCVGLLFVSCTEKIDLPQKTSTPIVNADKGYLSFSSAESFAKIMNQIKKDSTSNISALAGVHNFTSISELKKRETGKKQLTMVIDGTEGGSGNDAPDTSGTPPSTDGIEEGTQDEYNLAKAEHLINDPDLAQLMDTTLRIVVGDTFYKITESGVFYGSVNQSDLVTAYALNYGTLQNQFTNIGEDVSIYNGIYRQPINFAPISPVSTSVSPNNTSAETMNKIAEYNLDSYEYDLDGILLRSCSNEKYFDDNHRVRLKIYDDNYVFYRTQGVVVRFETRKRSLLWHYWADTSPQALVLGFNHMKSTYTCDFMQPFGKPFPLSAQQIRTNVIGNISNYGVSLALTGLVETPFLKDFMHETVPHWVANLTNYSISQCDDMSGKTFKLLTDAIRKIGKNAAAYSLGQLFPQADSPQILNFSYVGRSIQFALVGERNFGSTASRKIVFHRSGGGRIGLNPTSGALSFGSFQPTSFKLNEIDVYGAAKYNNRWMGVRLYKYKN